MKILTRGIASRYSGYGNDWIDMTLALTEAGADVVPWPTHIDPGLPVRFTNLLTKSWQERFDVTLSYVPALDLQPDSHCGRAPKTVGYTMWERESFTREDMKSWTDDRTDRWWSQRDNGKRGFDAMWVTCADNIPAFQNMDKGLGDMRVICTGINGDDFPEAPRDRSGPIRFGMCGLLGGRKDPANVLKVWQEIYNEVPGFDGLLDLRTLAPGLHPGIMDVFPGVMIYDRPWERRRLVEWYQTVDVLISISRGEGVDKPAQEAMATGATCILSDWGGHREFGHPEITFSLPGVMKEIYGGNGARDFRIDPEDLKRQIVWCWENRGEVNEHGKRAASYIRSAFGWDKVADRILRGLEAELGW